MEGLFLLSIATIGIMLYLFLLLVEHKVKKEYWHGYLEDKKVYYFNYKGKQIPHYVLYFKKENGKKVKYVVDYDIYTSFNKGVKVVKIKSKHMPIILNPKSIREKNII